MTMEYGEPWVRIETCAMEWSGWSRNVRRMVWMLRKTTSMISKPAQLSAMDVLRLVCDTSAPDGSNWGWSLKNIAASFAVTKKKF